MDSEPERPDSDASSSFETLDTGPVHPSPEVRAELASLLGTDESRLGEVYRGLQRGLDAGAIADELGVATSNFVWNYERAAKALLDGDLPWAPTVALSAARKFRSILRSARLSPAARAYLDTNLGELERRANDETARVVETKQAQEQTQAAEARNEIGIYVYALPHYLRYPFDPESGRTLMKVGRSDSDIIRRFQAQTRTTALPEEPILLRIYRTDGAAAAPVENNFHRLLEAADHTRSVARSAGREWFLTTTRFLDEIAKVMKLSVVVVNDTDVLDED
jgi:T5orf172 domain